MPRKKQHDPEVGDVYAGLCRAGRALLDWTREKLAEESQLSVGLIKKYETSGPWTASASAALRETFRKHGIDVEIDEAVPPMFHRVTRRHTK